MKERPVAIVLCSVVVDDEILLIRRILGDYVGLLSLPGGKIENDEHVSEAATREVMEETGLNTKFVEHAGFVDEHLVENGNVMRHFLMHVCKLYSDEKETRDGGEGELVWVKLNDMQKHKNEIIPSDYNIIENMIKRKTKQYYECEIEKIADKHILRKFE